MSFIVIKILCMFPLLILSFNLLNKSGIMRKRRHIPISNEDSGAVEVMETNAQIESKKDKWEPNNWIEVLNNIREMRKSGDAPVDTMGCDKCMEETALPNVCIKKISLY